MNVLAPDVIHAGICRVGRASRIRLNSSLPDGRATSGICRVRRASRIPLTSPGRRLHPARIRQLVVRRRLAHVALPVRASSGRCGRGCSGFTEDRPGAAASSADPAQRRRRPAAAGQAVADAAERVVRVGWEAGRVWQALALSWAATARARCAAAAPLAPAGPRPRSLRVPFRRPRAATYSLRAWPAPFAVPIPIGCYEACARIFLRFSLDILRTMNGRCRSPVECLNVEQQWLPVQLREHWARGWDRCGLRTRVPCHTKVSNADPESCDCRRSSAAVLCHREVPILAGALPYAPSARGSYTKAIAPGDSRLSLSVASRSLHLRLAVH